jgi:uncharacterized protein (DUF1778 family)
MKTSHLDIRCSPEEKALWKRAADLSGMTLTEWIVSVLLKAAREALESVENAPGVAQEASEIQPARNTFETRPRRQADFCSRCWRLGLDGCANCPVKHSY